MYEHLRGTLVEKTPTRAVVDVGGIGFELTIPLSSFEALPGPGERAEVFTHHHVREDAHRLFGFASRDERRFFRRLLDVQGIGPAVALSVLSSTDYASFRAAVVAEDLPALTRLKGIGRKLAQRIVLDLREALLEEAPETGPARPDLGALSEDAVQALVTLGYSRGVALREVESVLRDAPTRPSLEEIVRVVLRSTR